MKIVTLVGYTDGLGSRNNNLAITEECLTAGSKWLRAYGVSPRQFRRSNIGHLKMIDNVGINRLPATDAQSRIGVFAMRFRRLRLLQLRLVLEGGTISVLKRLF